MDDLISRQEAIEHFRKIVDATSTDTEYNDGFVDGLEFAISHLSGMLSVKPNVIHCKDCEHSTSCLSDVAMLNKYRTTTIYKPIDFCSYAKRRDDETD